MTSLCRPPRQECVRRYRIGSRHQLWMMLGTILLIAGACGTPEDPEAQKESLSTQTTEPVASSSVTSALSSTTTQAVSDVAPSTTAQPSQPSGDPNDVRTIVVPALGGLKMELGADLSVIVNDDIIGIADRNYAGESNSLAGRLIIGRISQTDRVLPLATLDDVVERIVESGGAEVAETGETLMLLGHEATLYRIEGDLKKKDFFLFSSGPQGFFTNAPWSPLPLAELFMAQLDQGVLFIGSTALDEEGLARGRELLERVLPTLELTTPDGQVASLPDPASKLPRRGEAQTVVPVPYDPDGPALLDGLFGPIDGGEHQVLNLSPALFVTTPNNWAVQLNFPGVVVLTDDRSFGPGDRGLVFRQGINQIQASGPGESPLGDPIPIDDIEAFLAAPPPNLLVTDILPAVDVGGLRAVQFDLQIREGSTCRANDPCQFTFTSPIGQQSILPDHKHRIWWIVDVPSVAPLMIIASAPSAEWLESATDVVSSIEFQ